MIVVAIIGILAAVAIPAYQDYTIKSKVSEAASLVAPALANMGTMCSEGRFASASTNALVGLPSKASISGKYIKEVEVTAAGVVTVTTNTMTELGQASANTVTYTGNCGVGSLTWTVGGGIDTKYRPKT